MFSRGLDQRILSLVKKGFSITLRITKRISHREIVRLKSSQSIETTIPCLKETLELTLLTRMSRDEVHQRVEGRTIRQEQEY